jgi:hypothetical protein
MLNVRTMLAVGSILTVSSLAYCADEGNVSEPANGQTGFGRQARRNFMHNATSNWQNARKSNWNVATNAATVEVLNEVNNYFGITRGAIKLTGLVSDKNNNTFSTGLSNGIRTTALAAALVLPTEKNGRFSQSAIIPGAIATEFFANTNKGRDVANYVNSFGVSKSFENATSIPASTAFKHVSNLTIVPWIITYLLSFWSK